jgi:competence protein ComEC
VSLALSPAEPARLADRLRSAGGALLAAQRARFAPWLAVALGAGVVAYFTRTTEPGPAAGWAAACFLLLALALRRRPGAAWLAGLAAASCLGFAAASWHASRMPPPLVLPFGAVVLSGTVAEVEALPESLRVTVEEARVNGGEVLPRRLRVRLRADDPARPEPGQAITVRASLREPGAPAVPGGWDFQRAAFFSGLGGSGFALGPAALAEGEGASRPFAALRRSLDQRIRESIGGPAGAIASALVTGSQTAIAPAEMAAMRDSGLAHLLSVSGLHMTIVIGAVFSVTRLLLALVPAVALRVPGKALAALAGLGAGGFYMLLTGSQVPMQRCLAMAALVTLALLAGRRALSVRVIGFAAAAVMLAAPVEILGPSFQMSFAAVLALVAGHEALRPHLSAFLARPGAWRRPAALLAGLVVTSVLAGAATAPFGLHHFGRLQLYGVVANAITVPLTSFVVMPAAMLSLLLMPLGLEGLALRVVGLGVEAVLLVARLVAAWPGAAPALPPIGGAALAIATTGFLWLCLWRGALRWPGVPVIAAGLGLGLAQPAPEVLVSADARLIAFRTADGVFLHRVAGAGAFARDAMLRAMGAEEARPLPDSGEAAGGAISCTPQACRFRPHPDGPVVVLLRAPPPARGSRRGGAPDPAALAEACGHAVLILSSEPVRPRCSQGVTIDRFATWREGAHAAWLHGGGVTIASDRGVRGERPWVPPLPLPGRPEPLPLAPSE